MSNLSKYEKLLYKHNRLKRHCGNQMNKIVEYKQELQRKDNNWNELKKMLEENKLNIAQALNFYDGKSYNGAIIDILDKIKELENSGSDE